MSLLKNFKNKFPVLLQQIQLARKSKRLAHAYLVHGDTDAIREGFSTVLAQIAACPTPSEDGGPCLKCKTCLQIESGEYPELFKIMPSSKSRIIPVGDNEYEPNTMRWFENQFYFTSVTEAGIKIGVIMDADRMQPQGQNAFLKTLEEPPSSTFFILATGNPSELLPTIRSRCQKILLLENKCSFDFDESEKLFKTLFELQFRSAGNIGAAEKCANTIIDISDSLHKKAEEKMDVKWEKKLDDAKELDSAAAKKNVENRYVAAIEAEYLKYRTVFLSALHSWFAQIAMLSEGVDTEKLPNPEILSGIIPAGTEINTEAAFKALEKADMLLQNLNWNVNEELALREFCLAVSIIKT